jgi:hypothetical protein
MLFMEKRKALPFKAMGTPDGKEDGQNRRRCGCSRHGGLRSGEPDIRSCVAVVGALEPE